MPHALRALKTGSDELTALSMLCGFDDDLAAQITQVQNRIRGLLTQIHPALEPCSVPAWSMRRCAGCSELSPRLRSWPNAGRDGCHLSSESLPPRMHQRLAADIMPPPLRADGGGAGHGLSLPGAAVSLCAAAGPA